MTLLQAKQEVLDMAVRCYKEALMAGTSGNLSVLTDDQKLVITPSSVDYSTMTVEDIMVTTLDGEILEGPHKPSSEWRMHAQIYKNLPHLRAVVHTHSPYATSFAVINQPVPVILIEMMYFLGGDVPVSDFALPGTDDVGRNAVKSLADRNACLMQNHGVLAVGETLQKAYIRAVYTEDAAKICHMAKCIGQPVLISQELQDRMLNR
ncbi:class II aldolase/adducin family protein [Oscillospiraceae bacterium MB08-C2-2]|nr:class II aldolase/adducin family protein [Oscillospiraceae bacterium MB08-C2-2]